MSTRPTRFVLELSMPQASLFSDVQYPPGFDYRPGFLSELEQRELLQDIRQLEFANVEMRGVVARRRTVHFGWTYGYYARRTEPGPPLPPFLLPYRHRLGEWAGVEAASFVEALVTEYPAGAPIGWHRDAPAFGDVIAGISLENSARMKFRPYVSPSEGTRERRETTHEVELEPRSAYLITDAARRDFEHSIPPVASHRYSITFRTLR
jgi:DNA oxidative demethylase